ncbi:hypothetical protein KKA17_03540 [bacterium]|nr:hypothetical protein [bacterium]MBU1883400.1 hypothetical protein [bacterium]
MDNRRIAQGKIKPITYFILQLIILELICYMLYLYVMTPLAIMIFVILHGMSLSNMIDSYNRVLKRQQEILYDIEMEDKITNKK